MGFHGPAARDRVPARPHPPAAVAVVIDHLHTTSLYSANRLVRRSQSRPTGSAWRGPQGAVGGAASRRRGCSIARTGRRTGTSRHRGGVAPMAATAILAGARPGGIERRGMSCVLSCGSHRAGTSGQRHRRLGCGGPPALYGTPHIHRAWMARRPPARRHPSAARAARPSRHRKVAPSRPASPSGHPTTAMPLAVRRAWEPGPHPAAPPPPSRAHADQGLERRCRRRRRRRCCRCCHFQDRRRRPRRRPPQDPPLANDCDWTCSP